MKLRTVLIGVLLGVAMIATGCPGSSSDATQTSQNDEPETTGETNDPPAPAEQEADPVATEDDPAETTEPAEHEADDGDDDEDVDDDDVDEEEADGDFDEGDEEDEEDERAERRERLRETDRRCINRSTGDPLEPTECPDPEMFGPGFAITEEGLSVQITVDGEGLWTFSVGGSGDEFRLVETKSDGTVQGFFGQSFFGFIPDATWPSVEVDGDTMTFTFNVELVDGQIMVNIPGGETPDGMVVEAMTIPLQDFTIYHETDDSTQGTYYWDPILLLPLFETA